MVWKNFGMLMSSVNVQFFLKESVVKPLYRVLHANLYKSEAVRVKVYL